MHDESGVNVVKSGIRLKGCVYEGKGVTLGIVFVDIGGGSVVLDPMDDPSGTDDPGDATKTPSFEDCRGTKRFISFGRSFA